MEQQHKRRIDQGDCQKLQRRDKQIAQSKEVDDLPHDLIIEILLRLPPKAISKFRCVSKQWYHLLTRDNEFIARYGDLSKQRPVLLTRRYIVDRDDGQVGECRAKIELTSVDLEGNVADRFRIVIQGVVHTFISCGPLVLLCCTDSVYVCDPSFDKAMRVVHRYSNMRLQNTGFGYLPASREYKIVNLYEMNSSTPNLCCRVFTFENGKTGSWKRISEVCPKNTCTDKYSVSLDGKIYWARWSNRSILAFDLEKDKFNIMSYPPHDSNMYSFLEITGIRGSLGVIGSSMNLLTMGVWLFNDKEKIWFMERQISLFHIGTINYVVCSTGEGDEIVVHTEKKGLISYNINNLSYRRINYFEDVRSYNRPCAYHYSLLHHTQ